MKTFINILTLLIVALVAHRASAVTPEASAPVTTEVAESRGAEPLCGSGQPAGHARPATLALPSYVRVTTDSLRPIEPLPDSVFNRVAGSTVFKVNRTEINRQDPVLRQLADSALRLIDDSLWVLAGIELRGAASPEGPYANNVRLSRGRAKALVDFIAESKPGIDTSDIDISTVAEDYQRLLWMMQEAGDLDATALDAIIDVCGIENPAAIKKRLQSYDNGRLWKRLLSEYFPALRSARFVIYFRPLITADRIARVDLPPTDLLMRPGDVPLPLAPEHITLTADRPHMLSVSTNLLYDAFYMPQYGWAPMVNIGAEYYPRGGNYTFKAAVTFPYYHRWSRQKFFQIRDYHLEARRYFKPGQWHTGFYLGAYVNAVKYGVGLSGTKGWQGEGIGAAVKAGYVVPLGRGRWRLDFHAAFGGFTSKYDPYVYGNPVTGEIDGKYYYNYTGPEADFIRRNHRFSWLGPTELGVTLSYDLLFYRLRHGGASFIGKEVWP